MTWENLMIPEEQPAEESKPLSEQPDAQYYQPNYADLLNRFSYHPPTGYSQAQKYEDIRTACRGLAELICTFTPPSREQALAITNLEQTMFWANAAIARNEQ